MLRQTGHKERHRDQPRLLVLLPILTSRSRTVGIQAVQQRFLAKKGDESDSLKRQIINIGCGYDTNVFSLFLHKEQHVPFKYVELDLKEVVEKKVPGYD